MRHPNRKRVLRRIANVLNCHYFGVDLFGLKMSPAELRFQSRLIRRYMRDDASGLLF